MANFGLGLRALFRTWSDAAFAARIKNLLEKPAQPAPAPAAKPESRRSDALSLLAVLQREARFVDFVMEPITGYTDAQIGAAARDVHRGCAAALQRAFAVQPLRTEAEGAAVQVPTGFDPAQFKLTGNVAGQPPFRGALAHHGWKATKVELPAWTGTEAAAQIIAPAEVELK